MKTTLVLISLLLVSSISLANRPITGAEPEYRERSYYGSAYEDEVYNFIFSDSRKDIKYFCGQHKKNVVKTAINYKNGNIKIIPCQRDALLTLSQIKTLDEFIPNKFLNKNKDKYINVAKVIKKEEFLPNHWRYENKKIVKIIARSLIYRLNLYKVFEKEGLNGLRNSIQNSGLNSKKYLAFFFSYLADSPSRHKFIRKINLSRTELIRIFRSDISYYSFREVNTRELINNLDRLSFWEFFSKIVEYKK